MWYIFLFIFVCISASEIKFENVGHAVALINAYKDIVNLDNSNNNDLSLRTIEDSLKNANSFIHYYGCKCWVLNNQLKEYAHAKYYSNELRVTNHNQHFDWLQLKTLKNESFSFTSHYQKYKKLETSLNHWNQSTDSFYVDPEPNEGGFYLNIHTVAKAVLSAKRYIENNELQKSKQRRNHLYKRAMITFSKEYFKTCIVLAFITGGSTLFTSISFFKGLIEQIKKKQKSGTYKWI